MFPPCSVSCSGQNSSHTFQHLSSHERLCKVIPINFCTAAQGVLYLVSFTNCLKRALVTGVSSMLYAWKAIPLYRLYRYSPISGWQPKKSVCCTSKETSLVPGAPDSSSPPMVKLRAWFRRKSNQLRFTGRHPELQSWNLQARLGSQRSLALGLTHDPKKSDEKTNGVSVKSSLDTGESPTEPPKHQGKPWRIRQSDR